MDEQAHGARVEEPHEPPSACSVCGGRAEDELAVLTWTLDAHDDRWDWICPDCSRDHLRAIEARLDAEWW